MNDTFVQIKKQSTLLKQQMAGTFAAEVIPHVLYLKPDGVRVYFENEGKSISPSAKLDLEISFWSVKSDLPALPIDNIPIQCKTYEARQIPNSKNGNTEMESMIIRGLQRKGEIGLISQNVHTVVVIGDYSFDDGFDDNPIRKTHCWQLTGTEGIKDGKSNYQIGDFADCNAIIERSIERRGQINK